MVRAPREVPRTSRVHETRHVGAVVKQSVNRSHRCIDIGLSRARLIRDMRVCDDCGRQVRRTLFSCIHERRSARGLSELAHDTPPAQDPADRARQTRDRGPPAPRIAGRHRVHVHRQRHRMRLARAYSRRSFTYWVPTGVELARNGVNAVINSFIKLSISFSASRQSRMTAATSATRI